MNRTISSFDMIVRQIEKGAIAPNGYKLLFFDEKHRYVLSKEPSLLQGFGKKIGSYIVSVNEIVKCEGITYILENGIAVNISFTAKCGQNNEERMLKELYDQDKSFEIILNDKIRNFMQNFLEKNQESISTQLIKKAEENLIKKCLTEIGLIISPLISFQAESNLQRFQIKSSPFSVRLQDYKDTISLEYEIEIWVGDGNIEKALLKLPSIESLNNNIKEIVIHQLWENVTLNQFCLGLNIAQEGFDARTSVKEILTKPINSMLAEEGRKIGHFELTSASIENIKPKDQLEIDHLFSYKIADENEVVGVKSRVSLKLIDIAAFKKAEEKYRIKNNSVTIEGWFRESVITPLIKDILFDKTYKNVLLHPESIKEEIEDSIFNKAKEIGYAIKQHTHLPDIKKLKLRDGFSISLQDEEFETKSSDIKIKLNIIIKGKVSNLDELEERLLHPAVDIEAEMKSEIRSAIEDEIHCMDPEQIYLRFSFTDDKNELPVDEKLSAVVTECLTKRFEVDQKSLRNIIKLSQSEDEFIRKTRELRKDLRKFDVTVYPISKDSYVEPLVYEIQYRILGVNQSGWSIFLSRISKEVSIQFTEIENFLSALIVEKLNSVDYATLKSENIETKEILKNGISKYAAAEVADKFGLLIEFYTFIRARSETEKISINTSLQRFQLEETALVTDKKNDIENIHEKIKVLRELEMQAIKREDLESAESLRKLIEELKKSNQNVIPDTGNIRKQIGDSKNNGNSIANLFGETFKQLINKQERQSEENVQTED